jgi:hypothetical protein
MKLPSPSLSTFATSAPLFRTLTTTPETGPPVGSVSLPHTHRTGLSRSCLGQVTSALNWWAGRRIPARIAARRSRFRFISHRRANTIILLARGSVSLQHRTANVSERLKLTSARPFQLRPRCPGCGWSSTWYRPTMWSRRPSRCAARSWPARYPRTSSTSRASCSDSVRFRP